MSNGPEDEALQKACQAIDDLIVELEDRMQGANRIQRIRLQGMIETLRQEKVELGCDLANIQWDRLGIPPPSDDVIQSTVTHMDQVGVLIAQAQTVSAILKVANDTLDKIEELQG